MQLCDGLHAFLWRDYRQNNCNTYLITGEKHLLIDPGHLHLFGRVRQGLAEIGLTPEQIDLVFVTHGHPDHIEASAVFAETRALFALSRVDHALVTRLSGFSPAIPEPDVFLKEGEWTVGAEHFQVLATPGHSPGSLCLYWPRRKALVTGDVLFSQGIGRSDLPGGSGKQLKESIRRLQTLDVELLLCGHGEVVVGKKAVQDNFRGIASSWWNAL